MLRIMPNVYAKATQTSDKALKVASDKNTAAVVNFLLASQICNALLGNSVILAIWKGFEILIDSNMSLFLWSEEDNGLLLYHDQLYIFVTASLKIDKWLK